MEENTTPPGALPVTIASSWHSYPKIWALGHACIKELLLDEVIIEEKIDGSQFSWGVFNGELKCRSKGAILNLLAPEKMFLEAVATVTRLKEEGKLTEGVTYRAEYLKVPKHNCLAYSRIPNNHLIGFDINNDHEAYLPWEEKQKMFADLGLETVPILYKGKLEVYEVFREYLERISVLGGQKIEGVVVKNYKRFGLDGKALMGKFVSEEFKETHGADWRERNPTGQDIIAKIINDYKTPARWRKAIQHLKERGEIQDSPQDIGKCLKEISLDTLAECKEEIKEKLFQWAWGNIGRGVTNGFPQWYKEELARLQFNKEETNVVINTIGS